MNSIRNLKFRDDHALFPASRPSWLNYTDEQYIESLKNKNRAQLGTEIHEWAAIQIVLGQTVSGVRDAAKSIKTEMYRKYYDDRYGLSDFGDELLNDMKYIPKEVFHTVKAYVNDAIPFFMSPETRLGYSDGFFGTCDAVAFDDRKSILRIFDLKTGARPAKIEQLFTYSAYYCLENHVDPFDISIDLRIYQNGEVLMDEPDPKAIRDIMDTIIHFDSLYSKFNKGELL